MKSKLFMTVGLAAVFAITGIASANLLTNGDFESSVALTDTNGVPTGFYESANWEQWAWNAGFSEIAVDVNRDGSRVADGGNGTILLNVGNYWEGGGGGAFQTVAATAGQEYQLTVDSGATDWWQPVGEMAMIFLDSTGTNTLGTAARFTVDPAVHGDPNDTLHPMESYVLTGVAPVDTAFVKVELASRTPYWVGGSVTFDNADLQAIPEPATLGLIGLFGGTILFLRRLHG